MTRLSESARLTNDGESLSEKWITYMDPINKALNTRADADLLHRVVECMREFEYYTQAIRELGRIANDNDSRNTYTALTIIHNALTENITNSYTQYSATSKYPKTYMAYELLFRFSESLMMISEIDEFLHQCGITVVNGHGDSPEFAIRRNLTWYPETDYYTEEQWRDLEDLLGDDDEDDED